MLDIREALKRTAQRIKNYVLPVAHNKSHDAYYNAMEDMVRIFGNDQNAIIIHPAGSTEVADYEYGQHQRLKVVVLPSTLTKIGAHSFVDDQDLEKIIIPEGVVSIGASAFQGCGCLVTAILPDSLTEVGEKAFYGCESLKLSIPKSLKTVGNSAFALLINNDELDFNAVNMNDLEEDNNVFLRYGDESDNLKLVIGPAVKRLPNYVFMPSKDLATGLNVRTIEFKNGADMDIGDYALCNCKYITNLKLNERIKNIGSHAFAYCDGLQELVLSRFNGVETIGDFAFSHCHNLKEIYIPDSVHHIGKGVFADTPLEVISVETGENYEGGWDCIIDKKSRAVIVGCKNTLLDDSDNVRAIGDYAFFSCYELNNIDLPESIEEIGSSAFYGCEDLVSIDMPSKVKVIKPYTFKNCINLEEISLYDGLTEIGNDAFYHCKSLNNVLIPKSVTKIGNYAFYDCQTLGNIEFEEGSELDTIGEYAFYGNKALSKISIPSSVKRIEGQAFRECTQLSEVHITDLSAWMSISFGGLFANPLYLAHNLYLNGEKITTLVIPEGTETLRSDTFCGCSSLLNVVIPNSVTTIGFNTFDSCTGLFAITIPESVTEIMQCAFENCNKLQTVKLNEGLQRVGWGAFRYCSALYNVIIPKSVTSIGQYAFKDCTSLVSASIKNKISIPADAFEGCINLKNIKVPWAEGEVPNAPWGATNATVNYNTKWES